MRGTIVSAALVAAAIGGIAATTAVAMPYTPFQPPVDYDLSKQASVREIVAGDFDGDRDLDVAFSFRGDPRPARDLGVAMNRGNAEFGALRYHWLGKTLSDDEYPRSAAAGDLDGDGTDDLVVGMMGAWDSLGLTRAPDEVIVLLGGPAGITVSQRIEVPQGPDLGSIELADIDGDGDVDGITTAWSRASGDRFVALVNDGDGRLEPQLAGRPAFGSGGMTLGDFDADGAPDIVTYNSTRVAPGWEPDSFDHEVLVHTNSGTGAFAHRRSYRIQGEWPERGVSGDLNGDGLLDLAVVVDSGTRIAILLGGEDGELHQTNQRPWTNSGGARYVRIADFNLDGNPDLAAPGDHRASILPGRGDGTFDHGVKYVTGAVPDRLEVADLNRDSAPDLVTANWMDETYSVRLNDIAAPRLRLRGLARTRATASAARAGRSAPVCVPAKATLSIRSRDKSPIRAMRAMLNGKKIFGGRRSRRAATLRLRPGRVHRLEIRASDRARNKRTRSWSLRRC